MVQELPVLHQHEGVASVQVGDVGVDHDRDQARARQRVAAQGSEPRPRDGFKRDKILVFVSTGIG